MPPAVIEWTEPLHATCAAGTTPAKVANEIAISTWTLITWECGKREPKGRFIPRIPAFLGYCPWQPATTSGARFRQFRMGLGLTQKVAAAIVNVDPATVARWEIGQRRPLAGYQSKVLTVLGCSP